MSLNVARALITFPRVSVGTNRVWTRNFLYFKRYFVSSMIWNFIEPLLYVVAFGYGLGVFVGKIEGIPYLEFFAPAALAMAAMQGSVFESTYSAFTKLRVQKTYETIVIAPIGMDDVVVAEILWGGSKSFFGVVCMMFIYFVLGLIKTPMALVALPVLFIFAMTMSAISMLVTSYARDYDSFTYFFTLFVTPMSLLSGTFFPLSNFPKWAQVLAELFPLTHAARATRALFLNQWENSYWISIGVLLLLFVIFTNWTVAKVKTRLIH